MLPHKDGACRNERNQQMTSSKPALIIIDVQKAIDHPSWGVRNNLNAEKNIALLLSAWRESGSFIVHIRHSSRQAASTYRPDQEGFEFKPEVQPLEGETVLTKHTNNAFIGTMLETLLRHRGITSVVITGVITSNSVEATARMAGDLGFETFVVADATATFDKVDYYGNHRTADEVHALSLANPQGEYAMIVSTDEVLRKFSERE